MVTVQESRGRLHISIPKAIAQMKGWKKGTILTFEEYHGHLVIRELK